MNTLTFSDVLSELFNRRGWHYFNELFEITVFDDASVIIELKNSNVLLFFCEQQENIVNRAYVEIARCFLHYYRDASLENPSLGMMKFKFNSHHEVYVNAYKCYGLASNHGIRKLSTLFALER